MSRPLVACSQGGSDDEETESDEDNLANVSRAAARAYFKVSGPGSSSDPGPDSDAHDFTAAGSNTASLTDGTSLATVPRADGAAGTTGEATRADYAGAETSQRSEAGVVALAALGFPGLGPIEGGRPNRQDHSKESGGEGTKGPLEKRIKIEKSHGNGSGPSSGSPSSLTRSEPGLNMLSHEERQPGGLRLSNSEQQVRWLNRFEFSSRLKRSSMVP